MSHQSGSQQMLATISSQSYRVDKKISVILPAFNESRSIQQVLQRVSSILNDYGYAYEVILVDDGSTDKTMEKALDQCADSNIKFLRYPCNQGKGYALRCGSSFLTGDFIIFMDSDLEITPYNLSEYILNLRDHDCDLVIACKRHPLSRVNQPIMRRILSLGFQILVRLLTGIKASDTQSGLKAFRRESLQKILPLLSVKKYAFDVEVLTVASLLGMKYFEMPVDLKLKARFKLKHIVRMFVDLLGIAYRLRIRRWYQKNINNKDAQYIPHINW